MNPFDHHADEVVELTDFESYGDDDDVVELGDSDYGASADDDDDFAGDIDAEDWNLSGEEEDFINALRDARGEVNLGEYGRLTKAERKAVRARRKSGKQNLKGYRRGLRTDEISLNQPPREAKVYTETAFESKSQVLGAAGNFDIAIRIQEDEEIQDFLLEYPAGTTVTSIFNGNITKLANPDGVSASMFTTAVQGRTNFKGEKLKAGTDFRVAGTCTAAGTVTVNMPVLRQKRCA